VTCTVVIAVPAIMITGDVQIKGTSQFVNFPATTVTPRPTGGDASVAITSTETLPANVAVDLRLLSITWSVSGDGGATWRTAGIADNEVFVTLAMPQCTTPFRTVLYLATHYGGTDIDSCFAGTWNMFAGPANVNGWSKAAQDYTRPLYYYLTQDGHGATDASALLLYGDGQCRSWADMLAQSCWANQVSGVALQPVLPPPTDETLANFPEDVAWFGVKNIYFAPAVWDSRWPGDNYILEIDPFRPWGPGVAGQNMQTPNANLFGNHWIVRRDTAGGVAYYDPSYGIQAPDAWTYTRNAIDGWGSADVNGRWRSAPSFPPPTLVFP